MAQISFWLMPDARGRKTFAPIITRLATQPFAPHVTLFTGDMGLRKARAVLRDVARAFPPLELEARGIDTEDRLNKTLFVRFAATASLRRMASIIEDAGSPRRDRFDPHLSLFYQSLTRPVRRWVRDAARRDYKLIIGARYRFDAVCAVAIGAAFAVPEQVEDWRVIAHAPLTPRSAYFADAVSSRA
jgi:hypothetical protein